MGLLVGTTMLALTGAPEGAAVIRVMGTTGMATGGGITTGDPVGVNVGDPGGRAVQMREIPEPVAAKPLLQVHVEEEGSEKELSGQPMQGEPAYEYMPAGHAKH